MINKKTVGIITMHKVVNYGSALQAYALQKVIADMGYNCEIIDYIYPNSYHLNEQELQQTLKITWKSYVMKYLPVKSAWRNIQSRKDKIKKFWEKYFKLGSRVYLTPGELQNAPPVYDIYVTGSDQVWNPRFMKGDPSFFLSFAPDGAQKVSFSSSFACAEIPDSHVSAYKKLLSEYSHISVREQNGARLIKGLLGRDMTVTLDPTLLLTPVEWKNLCPASKRKSPKKYILAYVLSYAFNVIPYIYDLIKHVRKELDYEVVFLGVVPKELKHVAKSAIGIGPLEFLELFENASFVVTSSFHGTSFAVNYNIPFYTVVDHNGSKDDRQLSLLRTLGIESRAVPVGTDFSALRQEAWDAEEVQRNLAIQRDSSLLYLGEALRGPVV